MQLQNSSILSSRKQFRRCNTCSWAGKEAVTTVTVPAGETMSLVARIELTEADKQYMEDSFPNGMYVEGFLYVNSADEGGVDLEMPFVGFYGDWSDAPVFDEPGNDASLYERLIFAGLLASCSRTPTSSPGR